jgi:hypothetical protein
MAYAIKAAVDDPEAGTFVFEACKTMYGGKRVAPGDVVYVFAGETSGGRGLAARGVAVAVRAVAPMPGVARQTPRVSLTVRVTARAVRPLGRAELKAFRAWDDGRPETELNFKFWRQATDKLAGISEAAAGFLEGFF